MVTFPFGPTLNWEPAAIVTLPIWAVPVPVPTLPMTNEESVPILSETTVAEAFPLVLPEPPPPSAIKEVDTPIFMEPMVTEALPAFPFEEEPELLAPRRD